MASEESKYRRLFYASSFITAAAIAVAFWNSHQAREAEKRARQVDTLENFNPVALSSRRDQDYDFTVTNYGFTYKGRTGDVMDENFLCYGAYEKHMLFFMKDYLQHFSDQETVYLDIGAHAGQHTFFMVPYVKEIHAFEPFPPALKRLKDMIELNKFTNIVVHDVGLGNKETTVPFYEPETGNTGTGTFRESWGNQQGGKKTGSFKVVVGDEALRPHKPANVRIIKIDVQGFEQSVLEGLKQTLTDNRPVVLCEVTRPPNGTIASLADLKKLFPADYEFCYMESENAAAMKGAYSLKDFRDVSDWFFANGASADVVAYPKEKEAVVPRKRGS